LLDSARLRTYDAPVRRHDRLATILDRLADRGSVEVAALATDLGVSASTVRRDLEALERQHLLERTHGGALGNGAGLECRCVSGAGACARRRPGSRRSPRRAWPTARRWR
jgi:predicted ArsR family transcriptional regulator